MSDQDAFDRILASLHAASLDDSQWPATSALIDAALGSQGNTLLVGAGPPDALQISFVGLYYRGERRPDLEREYLTVYHPIDECVPRFRQLPANQIVHATALYTSQELQTSVAYNDGLRRLHGQNSLKVRLAGPAGSHISWSPADPVAGGDWAGPALALFTGLLPHIRQFVRVRQALVSAGALGSAMTDLLETPRLGVLHLDRRGQILAANDRARALLRHSAALSDQGGQLRARPPAAHARLARLLAGALPSSSAPAVSGSMLLPRPPEGPPVVVHVKPVGVPPPDYGAARVAALVLLVEPGQPARLDPGLVATTLGLTPAESHVAVGVAEGQTVRELAATTGRQVSSIHWHLKRIYRKLGLARQAELGHLVRAITDFG